MNNELRNIFFAYLEAYEQGSKPKLEEWIKKYPQYRMDLIQFAEYQHVVEQTVLTDEQEQQIIDTPLNIEQKALEQAFIDFLDSAPLDSIVGQARKLNMTTELLASTLDVANDVILQLEHRVFPFASIPNTFLKNLASNLHCSIAQLQTFLEEPVPHQSPTFYHAKQQPKTGGKQSFINAVRTSRLMRPEQKERWIKIVAQEEKIGD